MDNKAANLKNACPLWNWRTLRYIVHIPVLLLICQEYHIIVNLLNELPEDAYRLTFICKWSTLWSMEMKMLSISNSLALYWCGCTCICQRNITSILLSSMLVLHREAFSSTENFGLWNLVTTQLEACLTRRLRSRVETLEINLIFPYPSYVLNLPRDKRCKFDLVDHIL